MKSHPLFNHLAIAGVLVILLAWPPSVWPWVAVERSDAGLRAELRDRLVARQAETSAGLARCEPEYLRLDSMPVLLPGQNPPKGGAPSIEQYEETIRISTDMVQVAFAVVDSQNRLVRDLRQAEVQLFEDGKLQKLELFKQSAGLPILLAVLIDISASQEAVLNYEKNAISLFLDSYFRPGIDYCALLTFQWKLSLSTGLTNNLKQLKSSLRAIEREQTFRDEEGGVPLLGTALYDALINTAREILTGKTARLITGEEGLAAARASEDSTQRKAIRRAVIVLTDGVDTASQASLEDVIRLYQRYGISIYALGVGDLSRNRQVNERVLDRLTAETGGMVFYPRHEQEIEKSFQGVVEALSSLYLVAYYPSDTSEEKRFRRIEVKLPGRPGLRLIHRVGYEVGEKQ